MSESAKPAKAVVEINPYRGRLMFASFLTLIASGVGFAVRASMGGIWEADLNISGQQFGVILGAGFLGFGVVIFFGGVLVEWLGYKRLLIIAFVLHLISAAMLFAVRPVYGMYADDPQAATNAAIWVLWSSAVLFSVCQGLYEAVINPMVGQLYPENQTHYLNILHAGWPGGIIIGGLFSYFFVGNQALLFQITFWEIPLALFAVFVIAYGVIALPLEFPSTVVEKAKGNAGKLFSCFLSPVFLLLLVLHGCIGYMELGVDSWMAKLMENLLPNAIVILVYTSFLMFALRFFAGPIAHGINPIGLLLGSSIIAIIGLVWLSSDITSVAIIFVAATVYSLGKAFLWPTMLGVVGERFPQSGAVAMGALGSAGMLTVGLIGGSAIGYKQAYNASHHLEEKAPETFERYAALDEDGKKKTGSFFFGMFPTYTELEPNLVASANDVKAVTEEGVVPKEEVKPKVKEALKIEGFEKIKASQDAKSDAGKATIARVDKILETIEEDYKPVQEATLFGGRRALLITAALPTIMAIGFLILTIYFFAIGGYKKLVVAENGEVVEADAADIH